MKTGIILRCLTAGNVAFDNIEEAAEAVAAETVEIIAAHSYVCLADVETEILQRAAAIATEDAADAESIAAEIVQINK